MESPRNKSILVVNTKNKFYKLTEKRNIGKIYTLVSMYE